MIKVSVVMALHNAKIEILKKSINSILNQTYSDYEFIIIDDINSQECISYLNSIAQQDKRVILLRNKKNIGLTKSLIKGISISKGEYIARQDADDFSYKERFKAQIDYLDNNPKTSILGTWYLEKTDYGYSKLNANENDHFKLKNKLYFSNPICHSSSMFIKSFYKEAQGYNPNYATCQDLDLWFKLIKIGRIAIIEKTLVERNLVDTSISLSFKSYLQVYNAFMIRIKNLIKYDFSLKLFFVVILGFIYHFLLTILLPPLRAIKLIFKM